MSTLHHPGGGFPLDPQSQANELRDIGAADTSPTLGTTISPDDVDAMWAEEMERRDRAAACPQGYRDTVCEACGCCLYVPVGQGGDVLCLQCQREGDQLAAEDDDHPRPPSAGALHPDYPQFSALACRMADDHLCTAIGIADSDPKQFHLNNPEQRMAFIGALSAEVVRRLDRRMAA